MGIRGGVIGAFAVRANGNDLAEIAQADQQIECRQFQRYANAPPDGE